MPDAQSAARDWQPTDDPDMVLISRARLAGLYIDIADATLSAEQLALHLIVRGGSVDGMRLTADARQILNHAEDRVANYVERSAHPYDTAEARGHICHCGDPTRECSARTHGNGRRDA